MVDSRVLWITGAGSGMGRAAAVAAAAGRRVVLSGRREDALAETAKLVEHAGGESMVVPLDAREPDSIAQAHATIGSIWGQVNDLVLSAGLNSARRTWADQSMEEVESVISTNLNGVLRTIDVVLPDLRASGGGQVIVVSSYSAWKFTPYAGVAYSASKLALAAVCQTLNVQEASNFVRACHLCPGDVDSDFLLHRPVVPAAEARSAMLDPQDIGRVVNFLLESPPHVRIDELVISPISQI